MPQHQEQASLNLVGFVQEGQADLRAQSRAEQIEQAKEKAASQAEERKTLQEQLRNNAIAKQEEFNSLVKEKNSFTRLSHADVEFYKKMRDESTTERRDLETYLTRNLRYFDSESERLRNESKIAPKPSLMNSGHTTTLKVGRKRIKGIIKKQDRKTNSGGVSQQTDKA
ncbi:LAMI_0B01596g1_1 [Lachancea mirantina]|uniref:LAMI_0B01596g1_1 n=1 Tax=Lachancea mirantina TaxID=1230905 RepID=A0A1G4IU78_9SACH|nr:LAMI_0B01596g1_1 [Lachancea mirantina]